MDKEKYGNREDKTKCELASLLKNLKRQIDSIGEIVEDIASTIYNEEYE